MFNGIIFNQGIIKNIIKRPKGINIFIKSNIKLSYQTKAAPGNRNPLTNRNTQFLLNIF